MLLNFFVQPLIKDGVPTAVFRTALEEVFAKFDRDNDGVLNEDELHALQHVCQGVKMTPELLKHIRANFEVDEQQRLTRMGLLQLYTKEVLTDEENVWMELGKFGVLHCFPSAQPPRTDAEVTEALAEWTPAMDQQVSIGSARSYLSDCCCCCRYRRSRCGGGRLITLVSLGW